MAMSLMAKKLAALPIGTKIELLHQADSSTRERITGTITDSDFTENIEITTQDGGVIYQNFATVCNFRVLADAEIQNTPTPKKKLLRDGEPQDTLNAGDPALKKHFDALPKADRQYLSANYDSFRYGVKINDRSKMAAAAEQARLTMNTRYQAGYDWSEDAVMLCGLMLQRAQIYDPEVYLMASRFREAALAAHRKGDAVLAGACALLELLEPDAACVGDMTILIAKAMSTANDGSALGLLHRYGGDNRRDTLNQLIREGFEARDIPGWQSLGVHEALKRLEELYPTRGIAQEVSQWLTDEEKGEGSPSHDPAPKPETPAVRQSGIISRLNWGDETGTIVNADGESFAFRYVDLDSPALEKTVRSCMRSDLGGQLHCVSFLPVRGKATAIRSESAVVEHARAIFASKVRSDRFDAAYRLLTQTVQTTADRRALPDLMRVSSAIHSLSGDSEPARKALALYEQNPGKFLSTHGNEMELVQCYGYFDNFDAMGLHTDKALEDPNVTGKQRLIYLHRLLRLYMTSFQRNPDRSLAKRIVERCDRWEDSRRVFAADDPAQKAFYLNHVLPMRLQALCVLGHLDAAEEAFRELPADHANHAALKQQLELLRSRKAPKAPAEIPQAEFPVDAAPAPAETAEEEAAEAPAEAEEIAPYLDEEGWDALGLTKDEAIHTALTLGGEEPIAPMLAYLNAAARLNPEIESVRNAVALASNDPMTAPDYDVAALMEALAGSDPDYPTLTDWCLSAAYLRASFLNGRGYDYSAQGLRDSLSLPRQIPALRAAFDTIQHFRTQTGLPMEHYAAYHTRDAAAQSAQLEELSHQAENLYTRFILTVPREGASLLRLIETKKILFAKDGELAGLLRAVMACDHATLEAIRDEFSRRYLNGSDHFERACVSGQAVDAMLTDAWEQAGRNMQARKMTAAIQGTLRNNLRCGITEILTLVCRWYALASQSSMLTVRTEQGQVLYDTCTPQLTDQMLALRDACARYCTSDDPQERAGAYLLADAAKEVIARLDGSWRPGQEKYRYIPLLRGGQVMLDENFLPQLDATLCAMPQFHILRRIEDQAKGESFSFQQSIDRIYGRERSCQNYSAARRILEYLEFMGQKDTVTLPENPELFERQTRLQADMRLRSFRETYALAVNCGRIMRHDRFCCALEDTARHFHAAACESGSYGFFQEFLNQAEQQIHTAAQEYEAVLTAQLEALVDSSRRAFDAHPGFREAIRNQITQQNFLVAEDWMHRIRLGDFSLELQKPQALNLLERFWAEYADNFRRVSDTSRPLSALIGRKGIRNKDAKGAQQLIDAWLSNGRPATPERISQLLKLLGWQNIRAESCTAAARTETYRITREHTDFAQVPLHPIAAFGSALDRKPMYAVCLYGTYDSERLFEKIRTLDFIDGSKVILLDYALGCADRRHLARMLKMRRNGLRGTYLVIDRVLLCHLADHYNENLMARMLMATGMPFSYYQPYVVESILTMPPEIFIGRKDELQKIEDADGVNLIYGGRQLGKSALFKKALSDIDGRDNQRALLVDIKELGCADAAKKLCARLMDLSIIPEGELTSDWDELCRRIERRLRRDDAPIRYLLLMMDEADTFISDCAALGYRPLAALKDVQQSLPGQFKFVLAGLHNIVRFNRQVALGRNSVITHLPSLKITPFRSDEAQELLTEPLSYLGFSLPSKVTVSQILATVNYFPGLIQLYCKKLIESIRGEDYAGYDVGGTPPYVITDEHLRRVLCDREFVEQIWEKLEITLTLGQEEGFCYYPLALIIAWMYDAEPSANGYSARDVLRCAKDLNVSALLALDTEQVDAMMQELMDLNILRCVSDDRYLLASKNFRDLLGSAAQITEKLGKMGGAAA